MILTKIVEATKIRVEEQKQKTSFEEMKTRAQQMPTETPFAFEKALKKEGLSFICEVKKASPSKGIISETFPYVDIAKEYERLGAAAISVLTEPTFFLGANAYLAEIRAAVKTPLLRKDFIIDPYQIFEAKVIGADAILLICSILTVDEMKEMIQIADELGLSCLVEAHTKEEIACALEAGARVIGVNNRDLKTFQVNIQNSISLRKHVPETTVFVSESGIQTAADLKVLAKNGTDAVLIGEAFMKSNNREAFFQTVREAKQ